MSIIHLSASKLYKILIVAEEPIYYYRTYENSQITAVDMHKEATDGDALIRYPMIKEQQIRYEN